MTLGLTLSHWLGWRDSINVYRECLATWTGERPFGGNGMVVGGLVKASLFFCFRRLLGKVFFGDIRGQVLRPGVLPPSQTSVVGNEFTTEKSRMPT